MTAARTEHRTGSSPLARGTLEQEARKGGFFRFIPAGAGNAGVWGHLRLILSVHPRWRGERPGMGYAEGLKLGSSPLARGTHFSGCATPSANRFIPAGAGNALPQRANSPIERGSSPLARGTPPTHARPRTRWRFIPAGAGNASAPPAKAPGLSVHPRWRGERAEIEERRLRRNGSSPLARGTRSVLEWVTVQARFIPAGAGNASATATKRSRRTVHPRWRGER